MTETATAAAQPEKKKRGRPDLPGRRAGYGRAKGTPNKATKLVKDVSRAITLGNEKVVTRLKKEAENGTIEPSIFNKLLEYGYGKPKQVVEIETPNSPALEVAKAFYESLTAEQRKVALDFARRRRQLAQATVIEVNGG